MKRTLVVLVAAVLFLGACAVYIRNHLVSLEESANTTWANVDVVLQRRYDLIPNFAATVQAHAAFDRSTFTEIAALRGQARDALATGQPALAAMAYERLNAAIVPVLAQIERYPDLRASESFLNLQTELEGSENRIAVARRRYNLAVRKYNTAIRRFPANLVARLFSMKTREPFTATPGAEKAPATFDHENDR